jgi:hypothetical protein
MIEPVTFISRPAVSRIAIRRLLDAASGIAAVAAILVAVPPCALAAEGFDGPKFRKGLWRFDRTLEYRDNVRRQEITRCVDPTNAMKGTFASPDVGNCRSSRAERVANNYMFENRCDYMGPVRTLITVYSDESYTERNIPKAAFLPVDTVTAQRLGDCTVAE